MIFLNSLNSLTMFRGLNRAALVLFSFDIWRLIVWATSQMFFISAKLSCCSNSCQRNKAKCISFVAQRFNNNYQCRNKRIKKNTYCLDWKKTWSVGEEKKADVIIVELLGSSPPNANTYIHTKHPSADYRKLFIKPERTITVLETTGTSVSVFYYHYL